MDINHAPFLIIISSPSGAGKTTLCKKVITNDESIKMSISTTTRAKRLSEIDGKDYHFISKDKFSNLVATGSFLESATVFGNSYGTLKESVNHILDSNKSVLFDIDWQGARQVKENFDPKKIISIFILPPSISELEKRLKTRALDSEDVVQDRMKKALSEIDHFDEYDYVLINDDIEKTFDEILAIINAKKISLRYCSDINKMIKKSFK